MNGCTNDNDVLFGGYNCALNRKLITEILEKLAGKNSIHYVYYNNL